MPSQWGTIQVTAQASNLNVLPSLPISSLLGLNVLQYIQEWALTAIYDHRPRTTALSTLSYSYSYVVLQLNKHDTQTVLYRYWGHTILVHRKTKTSSSILHIPRVQVYLDLGLAIDVIDSYEDIYFTWNIGPLHCNSLFFHL